MLELTCHRAQLADGQDILELGCAWGSLTLWMTEHFFTGRRMPSDKLLTFFDRDPRVEEHCLLDDTH
jgi:hypothetical protein